jgi:NAD(P)-dependent dehydrogenase (short-subunit alcohol dehydrogenase family)
MRLRNKVAIITGAGSGIGQVTAQLFGEEGAKVIVADVDSKGGESTTKTVQNNGGEAHFVHADISVEADSQRISDEAVRTFGGIDILVNNAASIVLKGFKAAVEEWERSLGVNVVGTALVTKYAAEHMQKNGGGAIVNLGSISSVIAQPDRFVYSASKGAILQMTRNMAMDLAPYKIRVNCVCPGTILTPASFRHMEKMGLTLEQFNAEEGARTFLKRVGQPREVACAILFLASDDASYITGASLMVDGGWTAQ